VIERPEMVPFIVKIADFMLEMAGMYVFVCVCVVCSYIWNICERDISSDE